MDYIALEDLLYLIELPNVVKQKKVQAIVFKDLTVSEYTPKQITDEKGKTKYTFVDSDMAKLTINFEVYTKKQVYKLNATVDCDLSVLVKKEYATEKGINNAVQKEFERIKAEYQVDIIKDENKNYVDITHKGIKYIFVSSEEKLQEHLKVIYNK